MSHAVGARRGRRRRRRRTSDRSGDRQRKRRRIGEPLDKALPSVDHRRRRAWRCGDASREELRFIREAARDPCKIAQDRNTALSAHRLRMELNAEERQRGVSKRHHDSVCGARRDAQAARKRVRVDDERVVTHRLERLRHSREEPLAVMVDSRDAAVHHLARSVHSAAKGECQSLVAKADAEEREAGMIRCGAHTKVTRQLGAARTRRDDHSCRRRGKRRAEILPAAEGVVAHRERRTAGGFGEQLEQVVRVAVIVVDEQQRHPHTAAALRTAPSRLRGRSLAYDNLLCGF